ncbi:response regulator transcription factor [Shinella sp.]|jgi:DNA-binding NarL/FixJ family response regulator|uniref:response regulator transcription factor n=1 Tax=Shinella sp. TaxID=1870904 RepID=UPI003F71673A
MSNSPLPPRITEVVSLIADGLTAKEIAKRLGISPTTIGNYVATAMAITGVHRSTALVAKALREGWIE